MHQGKSLGMVTLSIGVAAFPTHGMSPKELMAAADGALYEAKRGGRDQVAVALAKSLEKSRGSHRNRNRVQVELVGPNCGLQEESYSIRRR